jgi:hypothetical protein
VIFLAERRKEALRAPFFIYRHPLVRHGGQAFSTTYLENTMFENAPETAPATTQEEAPAKKKRTAIANYVYGIVSDTAENGDQHVIIPKQTPVASLADVKKAIGEAALSLADAFEKEDEDAVAFEFAAIRLIDTYHVRTARTVSFG